MKNEFASCSYRFVIADPKSNIIRIHDEAIRVKPSHISLMAHLITHAGISVPLPTLMQDLGIPTENSFKVTVSNLRSRFKAVSLADTVTADALLASTIPHPTRLNLQPNAHYRLNTDLIDAIAQGLPLEGIQTKPHIRVLAA